MKNLVIKKRGSLMHIVGIIALCLFLSTTTWFFLDKDHWVYIKSRYLSGEKSQELWQINRQLEAEKRVLREQLVTLERVHQIDTQAAAQLQGEVQDLQDENYRLKSELEFYRGIIAATRTSDGLNVQGMQIEPLDQSANYRFKLILTHVSKSDKVAEGEIDMVLLGRQDGVTRKLNIKDVLLDKTMDLSFKFKHFKRFEGNILLPEGFTPQRLTVQLHPRDKNVSKVKKVFYWSDMIS